MKSILVHGDVLAQTIALVLNRVSGISGVYRIVYVPAGSSDIASADLDSCEIFLHQAPYDGTWLGAQLPSGATQISFPTLDARHLWPFNSVNPYNRPEPPRYPSGRFPFGDSFIVSCMQQNVDPATVVDFYLSIDWDSSWPDLEALERDEYARLDALDAQVDIGMAAFVREHMSKKRLFWTTAGPTNVLLTELIGRMLDRVFGPNKPISRRVLAELLHMLGDCEVFQTIAVPIHPNVAKQFSLEWYDFAQKYNYFGEKLEYREYFERMVRDSAAKIRPVSKNRPTLIVYGNCQADAISAVLRLDPTIGSLYEVHYAASYGPREAKLADSLVAKCAIFLEQHDREAFDRRDALPADCTIVRFPSIDCNVLWPFGSVNPYNEPERRFPHGRFPYGDRVIIAQIEAGRSADEIIDYYLSGWDDYKIDLDRLLIIEIARFAARDAKCDVSMGTYLYERFAAERPLWTANHPTLAFLKVLLQRILATAAVNDERLKEVDIDRTVDRGFVLKPRGPLGVMSVPVHPRVAEHFQLAWYDQNEKYRLFDGSSYTYEGYLKEYIAHSIAKKMVPAH